YGQNGVAGGRVPQGHAPLGHADGQAAQHVDDGDDDGCDGVAFDKLGRAVHSPVKVRLALDVLPAPARLLLGDEAAVQVRVDPHLLARHRVQGKARRHLGHPLGAAGDDDELNHDQNQEHNEADYVVAADDELPEPVDDAPRVGVQQNEAGGADVEPQ